MKSIEKPPGAAYHASSPWTVERIEAVRRLAQAGKSASQIAERFNVSRNAVIGLCHRRKIKLGAKPGPKVEKASDNRWTVDDIKQCIAMREAGKSTLEIASALRRSERAVLTKLGHLGFPNTKKECPSRKAASRATTHKTAVAKSVERSVVARLEKAPPAPWNGNPVALLDAGLDCCRWPVPGPHYSPGGWYCGAPVARLDSHPWCSHHLSIGTAKVSTAAEREAAKKHFDQNAKRFVLGIKAGGRIFDEEAA